MNLTRRATAAILVMTATLPGCARFRDAPTPIAVTSIAASCARPVDTLLVLLPGAFDRPADFVDEGFVAALDRRGIAVDVALVDATVPYYSERTIVTRLDEDVLAPARARGIRHVWLAGISIGGLGALITANERRGTIDGLLLMAPYVGERAVVAEVAAAGGVARWHPPGTLAPDDDDRRLWRWLQTLTIDRAADPSSPALPSVWLGYGVDDRFATGHRLLAAALPPTQVFTAPGGHDWPAWRAVWAAMLDAAPLPRDPSCASAKGRP